MCSILKHGRYMPWASYAGYWMPAAQGMGAKHMLLVLFVL